MSRHDSELPDAQREQIAPLLPEPQPSPQGGLKPTPNRLSGRLLMPSFPLLRRTASDDMGEMRTASFSYTSFLCFAPLR